MKLTVKERDSNTKKDAKQIRRQGNIPAIIYSAGKAGEMISVDGVEFSGLLRGIKQGRLSTTKFVLVFGKNERKAIVKDIQYHPTTYQPLHIDFEELKDNVPVNVKIPIACTGVVECVGIKLGGFLRQVIRYVKVQCLPKEIPAEFSIDVRELGMRQSKRVSDLAMPKGVRPLAPANEVVVVIAKR
jgi:large subunit ribosomal protein L25